MIIKMFSELRRIMDEYSEISTVRRHKVETELKNTITEIKNILEGINSR